MNTFLILLSAIGFVAATPVNVARINEELITRDAALRNDALETTVLGLIEDLRVIMVTGSNDIPVLDPFELDRLHVDDNILPFPGAYLTVEDLKVSQLSTFVVNSLSINVEGLAILQRYRVLLDFDVPVLDVDARAYDLSVSALGVDLFGKGEAKIKLIKPRVTANLRISPRLAIIGGVGLYITIDQCEVKFALEDVDVNITGLLGDDSLGSFLNPFLRHFIIDAVKLYEPQITAFLSQTVQEIANNILQDLNISDIIGGSHV